MRTGQALLIPLLTLILFTVRCEVAASQRTIRIRPAYVNPPEVTLEFHVECDGELSDIADSSIRLRENGKDIPDFSLEYPWVCGVYSTHAMILLDRGESMGMGLPTGIEEARKAIHDYLAVSAGMRMDDMASLSSFNESVIVESGWTFDYDTLRRALDAVVAGGHSAIWDALLEASQRLSQSHPPHALLLVTAGRDDASKATIDQAIEFANRNGIRIYTIGVGPAPDDSLLQSLARGTGGRHFSVADSAARANPYGWIRRYELYYGCFASLTYVSPCDTLSRRNVELCIAGSHPCSDTICANYSYTADGGRPEEVDLAIPAMSGTAGDTMIVPILVLHSTTQPFYPAEFRLRVDTSIVRMLSVYSPVTGSRKSEGSLFLSGTVYSISISPNRELAYGDTIAVLQVRLLDRPVDTTITLEPEEWRINGGCLRAMPHAGSICILARQTSVGWIASDEPFGLENYPNPFSDRTTIQLRMTNDELRQSTIRNPQSEIRLTVSDLLGRELLDLSDRLGGGQAILLESSKLPLPGTYFLHLTVANRSLTRKIIFLPSWSMKR